jgi:hypothetical protein
VGDASGRGVPDNRVIGGAIALLTAIMSLALLFFVYQHGDNVPYFDDWLIVPAMTGHEPVTLEWLWSQHNEHRMPVQKLLLLGLYRASANDFRSGMYFSAAVLIALTALLLYVAFGLRNGFGIADAFIPLLLLSWGHYNSLLWSVCAGYLTITLIAVLPIWLITRSPLPSRTTALGMTGLVCLLPLTGAIGLAFAAPLAAWMILAAVALRKRSPRVAGVFCIGGILSVSLIALYFVGYRGSGMPPAASIGSWLRASVDFLSLSIGPLGEFGQNNIGHMSVREVWGYAAAAILVSVAILNAVSAVRERGEFVRRSGMALLIAGSVVLALGIGWGRRQSLWPRYVTLGAPGLLAAYVSTLLRPACLFGRVLRAILLSVVLIASLPNAMAGLTGAQERHGKIASFEQELRAGVPPLVLADHYSRDTRPPGAIHVRPRWHEFAADIRMLKAAGIGAFRVAADDPIYQSIDIVPDSTADTGEITCSPPQGLHIYAIRLSYQCFLRSADDDSAVFRMSWLPTGVFEKSSMREYSCRLPKDGRKDNLLVWVNGRVSQFHIFPDLRDGECRITNVQLRVRPERAQSK